MMPARWRSICGALACALAAGCAGTPQQIVIGPADARAPERVWEATLETLRAAGYPPEASDPYRGRIVVHSRTYGRTRRFFVQCYREGWVALAFEDLGDTRNAELAREHLAIAIALRERLSDPPPEPVR